MVDAGVFVRVREEHSSYLSSVKALLLALLDADRPISQADVSGFAVESSRLALNSSQRIKTIAEEATRGVIDEALSKSLSDAQASDGQKIHFPPSVNEKVIESLLVADALALSSLLRRAAINQRLLLSKNLKFGAVRIRVREWMRQGINNQISYRGSRFQSKASWRLYLAIRGSLVLAMVDAYMMQAAALGFTSFEIVQPGHRRHGLKFSIESWPSEEFHPQSEAALKLVR